MLNNKKIFSKKKILIYGFGRSGQSVFKFLKKNNKIYLYDDQKLNIENKEIKKKFISFKEIIKKKLTI